MSILQLLCILVANVYFADRQHPLNPRDHLLVICRRPCLGTCFAISRCVTRKLEWPRSWERQARERKREREKSSSLSSLSASPKARVGVSLFPCGISSRLRGLLFGPRVEGFALRARKKRGGVPLAKGQNSSAPFRRIPRCSSYFSPYVPIIVLVRDTRGRRTGREVRAFSSCSRRRRLKAPRQV